ncbi:hypothetical protein IMZ48_28495 [Candidatus Bathyarchaeota archaeon]|nr:hypothetical protein [Candidatus Bathyarchaeota archaeon]
MIPSEITWDPNATPPQFTNNEDVVIEKNTHVRVKILGIRSEVGEMWAIGSIKEDYLGYVSFAVLLWNWTDKTVPCAACSWPGFARLRFPG